MIYLFTVKEDYIPSYRYTGHYFFHNNVFVNITEHNEEYELEFLDGGDIDFKDINLSIEYRLPSKSEESYVESIYEDQALIDILEREKLDLILNKL